MEEIDLIHAQRIADRLNSCVWKNCSTAITLSVLGIITYGRDIVAGQISSAEYLTEVLGTTAEEIVGTDWQRIKMSTGVKMPCVLGEDCSVILPKIDERIKEARLARELRLNIQQPNA